MSQNWICCEREPLTDSLVCFCDADGRERRRRTGEGVEENGGDLGASMKGGRDESYRVVPHAGF